MKGYKVFNPDWTCRGFQYEPGKTFKYDGEIKLCKSGFHFCEKFEDCFRYYVLDIKNHVCEVETDGLVETDDGKSVTNKLTIGRELSWEEVCERLSKDEKIAVRWKVADNPNTPVNILEKLSTDEDLWVRRAVASNPNTPIDILEKLSTDEEWRVRCGVTENPNTPIDILEKLSEDKREYVRRAVAANLNTPIDILKKLSEDEWWTVRCAVATNPNTAAVVI